jgi:SPASM domain peptide maturase of grasp-with-spasm system
MTSIYLQYSNCIPVKGYNRSAIYDIQRVRYVLIDNAFADLLIKYDNKLPLNKAVLAYKNFIDELTVNEWGQYTSKEISKLFPSINLEWMHPAKITNALVDFIYDSDRIHIFFEKILPQFEELTCKNFEIHFIEPVSYENLLSFLISFDDTLVNSLTIILPYLSISKKQSDLLFESQARLIAFYYYSCPVPVSAIVKNENSFYTENGISLRNKNEISPDYFVTNIMLFTESQTYNTYYNRKLCIDSLGNIKNSPEHIKNYGNIENISLATVLHHEDFKILWYVHKGMIDVCNVCEFRHMCVDACIPKKRKNGSWFRSKECDYNPFISKWKGENGYKNLSECGVEVNEHQFKIDKIQLEKVNQEVWVEN